MRTIVVTRRIVAAISFLVTLGSGASIAISPQDMFTEAKACKAITNDKDRLKCFDRLFTEPSNPQNPPEGAQANWSIEESKSPTDGSSQLVGANLVGDTVLILRCKDQITEAAFSTQYNYLGYKSVDVQLWINEQSPTKEVWKASMNGRAAFAPDAIAFIQSLPDNGKLSIKTMRSTDGRAGPGNLDRGIGGVSA
jgi:hypothetical protein